MATIKEQKKAARQIRQAFQGKPARKVRAKSAADVWFEKMKAEVDLPAALASARAKMGK